MLASSWRQAEARVLPRAQIVGRDPLHYSDALLPALDRPAHVRAASGLAWLGDELAIVQDDANFVALRSSTGLIRSVCLPPGTGGRRRFETALGNRYDKLDWECCTALHIDGREQLLLLGSASAPGREQLLIVAPSQADNCTLTAIDGAALYQAMRDALGAPALRLNVEAVVAQADTLRLFHRGNGLSPLPSAFVDFSLAEVVQWLTASAVAAPPLARAACVCDLGNVRGIPFGFSDATALTDSTIVFLAAAEDSTNPIEDGEVLGTVLGVLSDSELWVTPLLDEAGEPARLKAEGIAPSRERANEFWVAIDGDDPDVVAELCRVSFAIEPQGSR